MVTVIVSELCDMVSELTTSSVDASSSYVISTDDAAPFEFPQISLCRRRILT